MYFDVTMIIRFAVLTRIGNRAAAINVGILMGQLSYLKFDVECNGVSVGCLGVLVIDVH